MKKIMFNDRYGLTKAVLEGRKTMTRRIIKAPRTMDGKDVYGFSVISYRNGEVVEVMAVDEEGAMINNILPKYKVGEVVAVAQSYGAILDELEDTRNFSCMEHWESKSGDRGKYAELAMYSPGGENKMFVCADEMPHQIRITNVRVERLQDISDEECLKEGIYKDDLRPGFYFNGYAFDLSQDQYGNILAAEWFKTPRLAFAALINRISGKGTWESNPWVYVYDFELVR